jgi:hypothetical protein
MKGVMLSPLKSPVLECIILDTPTHDYKTPTTRTRNPFKKCRLSVGRLDELLKKSLLSGKKRKRFGESDNDDMSLHSLDLPVKSNKRRSFSSNNTRPSSSNLLSAVKSESTEKASRTLKRSFSFRGIISFNNSKSNEKSYKRPVAGYTTGKSTPVNRRLSSYWYETVDADKVQELNKKELDRQEAIYELFKGEEDLVSDLSMVRNTYKKSMEKLAILTEKDLNQIFGHVDRLIPLHQSLVNAMNANRLPDGTTNDVGQAVLQWIPKLTGYISYCANQVYAKALLDVKRQEPKVYDFLQRCQDSPFSRKLDLWSFLDVPRSKLVKYPMLFRSIQKVTPIDHDDHFYMEKAIQEVNNIIERVDRETGRAKCQFIKDKLEYVDDKQRSSLIQISTSVICDGKLKNAKGSKLHVFLFDKILVLTRPISRDGQLYYQVYRDPIPVADLISDDSSDSDSSNGSFRSPFSSSHSDKRSFRINVQHATNGRSYTLTANDEHDKRQWMLSIRCATRAHHVNEWS